jgi:redox-sensitive bicupin YhaK (pirin superfamily)
MAPANDRISETKEAGSPSGTRDEIRRAEDRGSFSNYWLNSRFSFSFADYYDPQHVSFGPLRVLNEDWVRPATGFDSHPHRDMEIITIVLDGAVEHRDSTGGHGIVSAGEVQVMTAGTGVIHSEKNPSATDELHLYQIWIMPDQRRLAPRYDQARVEGSAKPATSGGNSPDAGHTIPAAGTGEFATVVSGRPGASTQSPAPLFIHQDASLSIGRFEAGRGGGIRIEDGRRAYLHVMEGEVRLEGKALAAGDAIKLTAEGERRIDFEFPTNCRLLWIDLP